MNVLRKRTVFCLVITLCAVNWCHGATILGNPQAYAEPCYNTSAVYETFEGNQPPGDEHKYKLGIDTSKIPENPILPAGSKIWLKFDSYVKLKLHGNFGRIQEENGSFVIRVHTETKENPSITVRGKSDKPFPNIVSVIVHDEELCPDGAKTQIWDSLLDERIGDPSSATSPKNETKIVRACGQKQLEFSELITNAQGTTPGDWPWHAAIFRTKSATVAQQTYICGGTLISDRTVVTAGHCVVENGIKVIPERLFVVLGKYNIVGGDIASQEKGVYEIILHSGFLVSTLKHDIALLKLASEVVFSDYVQPICLWDKTRVNKRHVYGKPGMVVGWGISETGLLSTQLAQATMPVATDYDCLLSYPVFFERFLNLKTFCAGFRNGTSVCNGDSGGGMYFSENSADGSAVWKLRGLVSVSVSQKNSKQCDPTNYVVFTDVARYLVWIENNQ